MYYLIKVLLKYDGYEWTDTALIKAESLQEARKRAESIDFTHGNGIEEQEIYSITEVKKEEYIILKHYL